MCLSLWYIFLCIIFFTPDVYISAIECCVVYFPSYTEYIYLCDVSFFISCCYVSYVCVFHYIFPIIVSYIFPIIWSVHIMYSCFPSSIFNYSVMHIFHHMKHAYYVSVFSCSACLMIRLSSCDVYTLYIECFIIYSLYHVHILRVFHNTFLNMWIVYIFNYIRICGWWRPRNLVLGFGRDCMSCEALSGKRGVCACMCQNFIMIV